MATRTNRRTLRNAAAKGRLFVKCSFHYTDDYAHDADVNYGRMSGYAPARLRTSCPEAQALRDEVNAHFERGGEWNEEVEAKRDEANRLSLAHSDRERDENPGCVFFCESDFRTKSGHINGDKESGRFSVHSNLSYEYKIKAN